MIVKLGAALSVQVQFIQLRGTTYQFRIRVPKHLVQHYGKPDIRKSVGTSDLKTASRLAEQEARKYLAELAPDRREIDHAARCRYGWPDAGRAVRPEL